MKEKVSKSSWEIMEEIRPEIPSDAKLRENLRILNHWLGIDTEIISVCELSEIIRARIKEQDEKIYPARVESGEVTSEWREYARERKLS